MRRLNDSGDAMNWDQIEGYWKQVKGKAKEQWGKLTDDDFNVIAGKRDQLSGKIQERYGVAKDEAERQIGTWERNATSDWFGPGASEADRDASRAGEDEKIRKFDERA